MATLSCIPYPFLRRSRCAVLTEDEGLHSPEGKTDATLLPVDSAMQATVGDAACPQEEVVRQFTTITNACGVQMVLMIKRTLFDAFTAETRAPSYSNTLSGITVNKNHLVLQAWALC